VAQVHAIIGASYGAMTALAFAARYPQAVGRIVIMSGGAEPHPASSASRELQRRTVALAIEAGRGEDGLAIARGLAMLTYRTREEFEARFKGGMAGDDVLGASEPGAYLRARGEAYLTVMSPQRFLSLSASIDRHRVDPASIQVPALLIGSDSDPLVPPSQMRSLMQGYGGPARLHLLPSFYGHDMFLKDSEPLGQLVGPYLGEEL
jgi:homoserine O-acetyltransferase